MMIRRGFAAPVVLVGLLLLLVVAGGAYYLGKSSFPISTLAPVTPMAPFSGWKEFKTDSFSVKYPNSWKMIDDGTFANTENAIATTGDKILNKGSLTISVYALENHARSADDLFGQKFQEFKQMEGDAPYRSYKTKSVTTISSYPAVIVNASGYGGLNYQQYFIFNPKTNNGAQISVQYPYDEIVQLKSTVDQILSTFKFTQ